VTPSARWTGIVLAGLALAVTAFPVAARPLDEVRSRGVLTLCAHPNALPFASRAGQPPGFQVELAEALARQLGVGLVVEWVTTAFHQRAVDCDIVLDAIAIDEVQAERGLRLSRPYGRSGVALALRPEAPSLTRFKDLTGGHRVAVQVGSLAARMLDQLGARIVPFAFEDEMLEALVAGRVMAAAVSPASVGYFNHGHPGRPLRLVHAYEEEPELRWNLAVGMRRSDAALRAAVDRAIDLLLADGSVRRIYARYGIEHRPPR
jgi:polar amino acid transport system substrate-binding protein